MAFSTNGAGGRGLSGEINVTPLIDVLLVLLIIFMVIVPMTPHGLETAPPTHQASSDTALSQPVLVDVERGQDGVRYRVNGQITEQAELRPRLAELLARRSARIIMLKGDSALGFGAISWVIDSGYADGVGSVELISPGLIVPGAARP